MNYNDSENIQFENDLPVEGKYEEILLPNLETTHIVWIVYCSVIFCLSVFGNLMVVYVLTSTRNMRTSTNLYLLNLALSDLLLSVICMPVTVIVTIYRSWLFGDILCKIFIYIQPVSVSASAYTLAAIAMERYIAICKPFQSRMVQTKSHACLMICIVWSVAFIVNLGYLFNIENKSYDPNNLNLKMCSSSATEKTKFFYQIYVTIVLLVVPLILMGVLYGYVISSLKMGIKMDIAAITIEGNNEISTFQGNETNKKQSKISIESVKRKSNNTSLRNFTSEKMLNIEGKKLPVIEKSSTSSFLNNSPYENTNDEKNPSQIYGKQSIATIDTMVRSTHSSKIILTKQRLIRMLIVIVIIFFICWTPTNIYWLLVAASEYFSDETLWDGNINLVLTSIAYLATCANPITYCFLNAKFRNALLHVWGCKKYDHRPNNFKAYHNNDKYCIKQELGTCESTSNIRVTNNKDNKVPVSQNLLKQYRHSISTNDYTSIMTNEKKKRESIFKFHKKPKNLMNNNFISSPTNNNKNDVQTTTVSEKDNNDNDKGLFLLPTNGVKT